MAEMTSLERILTTLQHKEPDRVPFFLTLTLRGAKDLGLTMTEYYSRPENVVEAQMRKRARFRDDIVTSFYYGAVEAEAFGCEVMFWEDGPPNAGAPIIRRPEDILGLEPPKVRETACLQGALQATSMLKEQTRGEALVLGIVISPFSLPVMQMGFGPYIELMYERPELFERLMRVNEAFTAEWANALVASGAMAIGYFDPLCSGDMIAPERFRETGLPVAKRMVEAIQAPIITLVASDSVMPTIDEIAETGSVGVGVSHTEDLRETSAALKSRGKTVLGNLNGIEMRNWTQAQAEQKVRECIRVAGPGGGYILVDAHGEIPVQVPDDVIDAIAAAVHEWGRYPLSKEL